MQFLLSYSAIHNQCNEPTYKHQILKKNKYFHDTNNTVHAKSDSVNVSYPKNIQLIGNVSLQQDNNLLTSDKLTVYYDEKKKQLYTLHATGNVNYSNDCIRFTGTHAWFNLNNKNLDLYNSTYHLMKSHIYGKANTIMQRKNNHYTIIKHGNFTTCLVNNDYWNITGSKIIYDHYQNSIDIHNACLNVKKIPIFYSPYLSLSLNKHNVIKSCVPIIKYDNNHGLTFATPFPLQFSKYYSGRLTPYYISNLGIQLQTAIDYFIIPGSGSIIFDIIKNKPFDSNKKYYQLYWKHNGTINTIWNINIDYLSTNNFSDLQNTDTIYNNSLNNHLNQKFLLYYNHKNWNSSLSYLGVSKIPTNDSNNHCNYIAAPQLEFNTYYNNIRGTLFNVEIFNQLTKFIPSTCIYPTAIRIHTEPAINTSINNYWGSISAETKLKITHYQQKNINYYNNKIQNNQYQLKNTINRVIPQFKIQGTMIFKKKISPSQKYQHILEPRLQYLYIPYCFQEHIGIYDTRKIYMNYKNLFHGTIYSGLDRITPANQITGDITMRIFNKKNELFYASVGKVFHLTPYNHYYNLNLKKKLYTITNMNALSGISHWYINNYWNIHTEIQYNTPYHKLSFGSTILEYIGKNNQILQAHYRYINAQYLTKELIPFNNSSVYHQTIEQLGIITYSPLIHNWRISCSHYHNIKTNRLIDQTMAIQYFTPCWIFGITFERKIIGWNKTLQDSIYDNRIQLNFNIYNSKSPLQSDLSKILDSGLIPYPHIF